MTAEDAIDRIGSVADALRQDGVLGLFLFGSVARGIAGQASDVDLFLDPDYDRFDFGALLRAEARLAIVLERPVDLVTRESLHPLLRQAIERDAVRII